MEADSDDSDLFLPSIAVKEESAGPGEVRIETLLGLDSRLSQVDRDFLLRFFQSQGLATVADLQELDASQNGGIG